MNMIRGLRLKHSHPDSQQFVQRLWWCRVSFLFFVTGARVRGGSELTWI